LGDDQTAESNFSLSSHNKSVSILIECTMSDTTHHEAKEASSATQVIIYVLLFAILAIFGDTFVFILGTIGLAVVAAATYSAPSHEEGHH
jgi:hypothetical protein